MPVPEQEYERPKGAPMWIVTFTDMISLLLTFFIMILTFSSMEEEKMQQATGSLSGAFGVMAKGKPVRTETQKSLTYKFRERDKDGVADPSIRKSQVKAAIKQVQDKNKFNIKIDRRDTTQGTLLTLTPNGDEELYKFGTTSLNARTRMLLKEIARMFEELPVRISVQTHIDQATPELLDVDAREWTLSMALSAAEVLMKEGISPERVCAQPRGDFYRVAGTTDKETSLDRFKNRRIEILILPNWREEIARDKGDQ